MTIFSKTQVICFISLGISSCLPQMLNSPTMSDKREMCCFVQVDLGLIICFPQVVYGKGRISILKIALLTWVYSFQNTQITLDMIWKQTSSDFSKPFLPFMKSKKMLTWNFCNKIMDTNCPLHRTPMPHCTRSFLQNHSTDLQVDAEAFKGSQNFYGTR